MVNVRFLLFFSSFGIICDLKLVDDYPYPVKWQVELQYIVFYCFQQEKRPTFCCSYSLVVRLQPKQDDRCGRSPEAVHS